MLYLTSNRASLVIAKSVHELKPQVLQSKILNPNKEN